MRHHHRPIYWITNKYEMVLLLVAVTLWMGIVGVTVLTSFEDSQTDQIKLTIKDVERRLHHYNTWNHQYPAQSEGFSALKYFKLAPPNPWRDELLYFKPARDGSGPFEVVYTGVDGVLGTSDDICSRWRGEPMGPTQRSETKTKWAVMIPFALAVTAAGVMFRARASAPLPTTDDRTQS